ncbi:MAG: tRNA lysidine(34) synthetase TilS [Devosiaceae bacterium]|nr:tRNA lysidine(34) synthetase TilS [Devosiaceae bacterium]
MLKPALPGFSSERLRKLFSPIVGRQKIALAVSGGSDSLGLMVLVSHWVRGQAPSPDVYVYSLNHGLRAEAAAECQMVGEVARDLGFTFRDLLWRGKKPTSGFQAAARAARYRLIAKAMRQDNVGVVLSGHHIEDQAETVLMRISSGSGLHGVRGMDAFSNMEGVEIFRPLLDVRPHELSNVLSSVGLKGVQDPSNSDEKYERVRWRKALLRLNELGLNSSRLSKFSKRMARADHALEQICDKLFVSHVNADQFGVLDIEQNVFFSQPDELALRLLSRMIFSGSGGRGSGELAQLEKLVSDLADQSFSPCTIAKCSVVKRQDRIFVFREAGRIEGGNLVVRSGKTIVWDQRFRIINGSEEDIRVRSAGEFSRRDYSRCFSLDAPMNMFGVGAAPLLFDSGGEVLGLGENTLDKSVQSQFILCADRV